MKAPCGTTTAVLGILLLTPAAPGQKEPDKRREERLEYLLGQARTAMFKLPETAQWNEAEAADQGLLLRALFSSRITADDDRIRLVLDRWLRLDIKGDLLARSERIWILALTRTDDAAGELRRLVDGVCAAQEADGGFTASARKGADPERILVTGRILEALAAAERLGEAAEAKVWQAALGFLLASQGGDGGFPAGKTANGAATARGLAALLAAAARTTDAKRHGEAIEAAGRAEKWLVQGYRPDRNPGAPRGTYEWIGALEPAMARAWLVRAAEHDLAEEVFRFLQGALAETGWNEERLVLPSRPGPGGGGRSGGAGTAVVDRNAADIGDTAWAALFLSRAVRLQPKDEATGADHRLASLARPGARAEEGDQFVERASHAPASVLPVLLQALAAEVVLVRRAANAALRAISGKDMGFNPQSSAAANASAITRWRDWARTR